MLREIDKQDLISLDVETTTKDIRTLSWLGIGFYWEGKGYYIDFAKFRLLNELLEEIKPILEGGKQCKIGHNLVFEYQVCQKYNIDLSLPYVDTMVAAWLLDERKKLNQLGLRKLVKQELDIDIPKYNEVSDADKCLFDIEATYKLWKKYAPMLEEQKLMKPLVRMEMPVIPVIATMQKRGIKFDVEMIEQRKREVEPELAELQGKVYELGGKILNLNSPKQIGELLFDHLHLRQVRGRSTDEPVLKLLAKENEVVKKILRYRELEKLRGTYLQGMLNKQIKGVLHPDFFSPASVTGRLSCSAPNLQNIPSEIRPAFKAREGMKFLNPDYNQIELRLAAHYSHEPQLIKAFQEGRDVHQETADALHINRLKGKTLNFAILFGMSEYGLAEALGISKTEALKYLAAYWNNYKMLKLLKDTLIKNVKRTKKMRLLSGRLRRFEKLENKHQERQAFNTLFQGSAADIMKIAMGKLGVKFNGSPATMLITVHDELLIETSEECIEETEFITKKVMENCVTLRVPLKVDIKIGTRWEEKEE